MVVLELIICIFQAAQLRSKEGCSEYCEDATKTNHKSKRSQYQNTHRGGVKKKPKKPNKKPKTTNPNQKLKLMRTTKAEDLSLQKYLLSDFLFSGKYC